MAKLKEPIEPDDLERLLSAIHAELGDEEYTRVSLIVNKWILDQSDIDFIVAVGTTDGRLVESREIPPEVVLDAWRHWRAIVDGSL